MKQNMSHQNKPSTEFVNICVHQGLPQTMALRKNKTVISKLGDYFGVYLVFRNFPSDDLVSHINRYEQS